MFPFPKRVLLSFNGKIKQPRTNECLSMHVDLRERESLTTDPSIFEFFKCQFDINSNNEVIE